MKILVCDEDVCFFQKMEQTLFQVQNAQEYSLFLARSEKEMRENIEELHPALLFMDVEFEQDQGIELISQMGKWLKETKVVFLSGSWRYVTEVYAVPHISYIHKSQLSEQLAPLMQRLWQLEEKEQRKLALPISKGIALLDMENILYLERDCRISRIYAQRQNYETNLKLGELQGNLSTNFLRCHNSYIVNMDYVNKMSRCSLILCNGMDIPVSRSHQPEIRKIIAEMAESRLVR